VLTQPGGTPQPLLFNRGFSIGVAYPPINITVFPIWKKIFFQAPALLSPVKSEDIALHLKINLVCIINPPYLWGGGWVRRITAFTYSNIDY
jgi:hypothetical protein